MRDQQIIEHDLRVRKACQAETLSFAKSFATELDKMKAQLQNASNVAIDNHVRHLAVRQVLENPPPLFTIFGIPIGRRRPAGKDFDEAYQTIKQRFAAQAMENAKAGQASGKENAEPSAPEHPPKPEAPHRRGIVEQPQPVCDTGEKSGTENV